MALTLPALNLPAGTAWFSLQSQNPLIGFELFGTRDGKRLAGFSAVDIEGEDGIFPKVEKKVAGPALPLSIPKTRRRRFTSMLTITLADWWDRQRRNTLNAHEKWVGDRCESVIVCFLRGQPEHRHLLEAFPPTGRWPAFS